MIFKSSFQSDIEHGRARGQKQPCGTIQPKPALMRPRGLAQNLQHQPVKLAARKTRRASHFFNLTRMLCAESPAQTSSRSAVLQNGASS